MSVATPKSPKRRRNMAKEKSEEKEAVILGN